MLGHSNCEIEGGSILWPDASMKRLAAGYDELTVYLNEDNGVSKALHCKGYLGLQLVGFWDEIIVESASVYIDHPFIVECEQRVKNLPSAGTDTRSKSGNRLLEIIFCDGCKLWICAHRFASVPVERMNLA